MLAVRSLYRKHIDACYECGRLGHRSDVRPNPKDKIFRCCGSNNLPSDHRCEPQCQLCGKGHLTEDRSCKATYKAPYIVKRLQLERRRREEEEAAEVYGSRYNKSISTGGNAGHYGHYSSFDNNSCKAGPTRLAETREAARGNTGPALTAAHRRREARRRRVVVPIQAPQRLTKAHKVSSTRRSDSRNKVT
ncbi:hypothetical protein HPB51_007925 [Rhipicephalus microplus]|uniref:Uncharacterized protein n=1 Tax=Rhipicephalus microplus TaxID=6941 RepID=A0A9J6EML2_RHIMP|nr:hypothetical protein HPB51_007925 [Rhipicephalus microplus]